MNFPIKTNQLRLNVDYCIFNEQYDVFSVSTSENYFKLGARILDVPLLDNRVCSIRFSGGKTFYAMMTHSPGNLNILKTVLQQDEDADKITISQLKGEDLYCDVITQLLLNGMASAQSRFLRFNNLTGQLYCFHPQWLKHSKKKGQDVIMKVPCLKVNVTRQLRMEATVCTFTSVLLRNKIPFGQRRFEEYPQYVLSVHNTLRRKLEQDTATGYIQRQTDNDRTVIPFIDFQNIARFEQSKMGVIWQVVSEFNTKYNGLARLSFEETVSYTALNYDRNTSKEDKQAVRAALSATSVRLVDAIGDEYSTVFCKNISELFSAWYGISVPIGKKVTKGHLNVRVIHNKAYYEGGHDPHDDEFTDAAVQHITLEDFADNCETAISTIVHELLIKQDLQNGRISLFNWQALNYQNDWSFGIASNGKPRRYYFMTVHPDGSFSIKESANKKSSPK